LGKEHQGLDFSLMNGPHALMFPSAPIRFLPSQVFLCVSFAPLRLCGEDLVRLCGEKVFHD
jgi:hypothetical protein